MTIYAILAMKVDFPNTLERVRKIFAANEYKLWPFEQGHSVVLVSSTEKGALALYEALGLSSSRVAVSIFPVLSAPFGPAPPDVYEWIGRNIVVNLWDPP